MKSVLLVVLLFRATIVGLAEPPSAEISKLFPAEVGGFRQLPSIRPLLSIAREGLLDPSVFRVEREQERSPFIGAEVDYLSPKGERITVELVRVKGDSEAYSLLTLIAKQLRDADSTTRLTLGGVGTASVISPRGVVFFKGNTFLRVTDAKPDLRASESVVRLARAFADKLDNGEGDIPVLVRHLPDWQNVHPQALYLVNLERVKRLVSNQPILNAVSFEGADAVVAGYGASELVIIEFTTPQLAGDNDRQVTAKIQELRNQNQPVPTSYRRVGNYGVFVFNGTSEQAANELIDQIKYEQVVQWLGDNPYWFKEAQRRYTETTLGVLVAVVKASGLTLVGCFGLGGLIGAIVFARRRARQANAEAFSDAGGMLRLNLDELTPKTDPRRLLTGRN